jgi:Pyruvate/2-oxoacid:ferredoxin oxidoreductase gamma subunit
LPASLSATAAGATGADVQQDQSADAQQRGSSTRHPIRAITHEAAHLRSIAAKGESPATPAILVGFVLVFIVPIAAFLILLAFGVMHFS